MYAMLFLRLLITFCTTASDFGARNESIEEAFPQVAELWTQPPTSLPPSLGGRDLKRCCLAAVWESLTANANGLTLHNSTDITINSNTDDFRNNQFSCGAAYIGDPNGAPVVNVKYSWCQSECDGWTLSKTDKINEWVSPLVGFVIPAIVFSLAIPRRRKINIPHGLFNVPLGEVASAIRTPFIAGTACLLAVFDTIQWLMTIFTLAGPILLSGIYEAILDSRILRYLDAKIDNRRLSVNQRAHLVLIVLVGNLDMLFDPDVGRGDNTPWNQLVRPNSLLDSLQPTIEYSDDHTEVTVNEINVEKAKTRLRTMLAAQHSFGVTVGAPVVFFYGSFLYTMVDNFTKLGDDDISHALAFGMWWMTIPHVAIVSGLLLAGNNSNILEGVVGEPTAHFTSLNTWNRRAQRFLAFNYDSRYRPAWIWNRGRSKRIWARRLKLAWDQRYGGPAGLSTMDFGSRIEMQTGDWAWIAFLAYGLLALPSTLAFLTSYYTPMVGLSCRSMTFLIYMISQFVLIALWICDIECTYLHEGQPRYPCTRLPWANDNLCPSWQAYTWYSTAYITGAAAIFTTIGGTTMQIMGVYRNCLCSLSIGFWQNPRDVMLVISSNTKEEIDYAREIWTRTGAGAITFLGCVTFLGWWYQNRLRDQFKMIIGKLGDHAEIYQEPNQQPPTLQSLEVKMRTDGATD